MNIGGFGEFGELDLSHSSMINLEDGSRILKNDEATSRDIHPSSYAIVGLRVVHNEPAMSVG